MPATLAEYVQAQDYEGILSLDPRRMTMARVEGTPYELIAADLAANCPQEIKRRHPYALLRLAYELYLSGMVDEYSCLMDELGAMIPELPLPADERRRLKGEWLIVSAVPRTRDVFSLAETYGQALMLLGGPSRVLDAHDSITAGIHGFPGAYLIRCGTADALLPAIVRVTELFSALTGEPVQGLAELYEGSLAYYRTEFEEAKRLTCKAVYLLENTHQAVLQITAGEMLAFIAIAQTDEACFAEALDYMDRAAARGACRGVADLCRCGLLNTLAPYRDTPDWLKTFTFAEGTLKKAHFGQTVLAGNLHFAPASSVVAFWHHTIYLSRSGQHARALAVSEIMLQRLDGVPVLSICFLLAAACSHFYLGNREKAPPLVEQAVELALPDRLYLLLSDFAIYLDGMVEACLRRRDPEALRQVRRANPALLSGMKALKTAYLEADLPESLTGREKEIARLAAQSMRNADIAHALGISENTVKAHLKAIFEKLDIDKRSRLREKLK